MVGLVIVSHSRALADALVALIRQIAGPEVHIASAAGVGENRQEFGTDAVEISQAIRSVYSPDGVLVMMDLGSAVLSAEMALELLSMETAPQDTSGAGWHVRLCPGPVVEGCLAAAVQIGLGSDLESVYREAQAALQPKLEHLGTASSIEVPELKIEPAGSPDDTQQIDLVLINAHGLHARPAARFVRLANQFKASIQVTNLTTGKGPVAATSLNSVATLGAVGGHQIRLAARGEEAGQAIDALRKLVEEGFGEAGAELPGTVPAPVSQVMPASAPATAIPGGAPVAGVPVSEGVAIGHLYHYRPLPPPISEERAGDPQEEWQRFENALDSTRQAIDQRRRQLTASLGEEQAAIFDAHLLIMEDPELLQRVRQRIEQDHDNAALAWRKSIDAVAASYRALKDPYLQQRAADVQDISNQLLFALAGRSAAAIKLPGPVVLFTQDLTPTETSQLDMRKVLGLLTIDGGPTSHSAILARGLGIPAIAGASPSLEQVADGVPVAMDGSSGLVWLDPAPEIRTELESRRQEWIARRERLLKTSAAPAATRDGRRIEVFANIGNVADAQAAVKNGAEGVGLLRTEFLFLTRELPPGEAEQIAALSQIGAAMGDRPVTVRTLDVGGDKEVPYLHLPQEANPFLGVRAIRMSLHAPDMFLTQLRAILSAGANHHFRIMFPMIATIDEIWQARAWLEKAHLSLQAENLAHTWPVETGIMVEVPSAAILSPILAREVDFFSIGTNDLTQYTLAAERGSPELANLADAMHPAVLQLIANVANAAHTEGKWVGVCGELAGDPEAAAVLIGLGVDELSLNPGGIPSIKDVVRRIDSNAAAALAAEVLKSQNAAQARGLASRFLSSLDG